MPPLVCHQEGHRIGEHQKVYCSVYWGPGTQPVQMSWKQPGQACFFISFVLDGHKALTLERNYPQILPKDGCCQHGETTPDESLCITIVLQIHSFHTEVAETLVFVFTKAYEIRNVLLSFDAVIVVGGVHLIPLMLLSCTICGL